MIVITPALSIGEDEIEESFIRASGPGGQHVNKTSTGVQLRFDVGRSPSLPPDVAARLMDLAGQRLTQAGVIVIEARGHRSQKRNREEALARLIGLIRQALVRPRPRHATRPTRASRQRRLEGKSRRSAVKSLRRNGPDAD